jgi:phosphate starvation-inducible membrane PsiE
MRIDEEQIFAALKSAGLAFAAFVISTIVMFIFYLFIFGIAGGSNEGKWNEVILLEIYYLVIAVCCFFIVKKNRSSVWYVPIIGNTSFIYFLVAESGWWDDPLVWVPLYSGLLMSVVASLLGARLKSK